jgi:hypothetical protein
MIEIKNFKFDRDEMETFISRATNAVTGERLVGYDMIDWEKWREYKISKINEWHTNEKIISIEFGDYSINVIYQS